MMGPFNDYNAAGVAEARTKRAERAAGICVYYRAGVCASAVPPHCPHHDSTGLCLGAGHCGDCTAHYRQPAELHRATAGIVG